MRLILLFVLFCVATIFAVLLPRAGQPPERHDVARTLLEKGRAVDATYLFEDPAWRGVAEYRAARYRRALSAFFLEENTVTVFNMGNSYARLYEWDGAKAAYRKVLLLDPDHADARHNLEIVLRAEAREKQEIAEESNQRELGQWEDGNRQEEPPETAKGDLKDDETAAQGDQTAERHTKQTENMAEQAGSSETPGTAGDEAQLEEAKSGVSDEPNEGAEEAELQSVSNATLIRRESTQAAEILLRQIKDDPSRVLQARMRAANQLRKQKDSACSGC
jgi:Ca-activated chloride channel family protein